MKINVVVKLQIEWIHQREWCPIEQVSFLRDKHRHIFHVKAIKEVFHWDRDIEIIMFKRDIEEYLYDKYYYNAGRICLFGNMSCEMIAIELIKKFDLVSCEILEDNENGSLVIK